MLMKLSGLVTVKHFTVDWHYYTYLALYSFFLVPYYLLLAGVNFSFFVWSAPIRSSEPSIVDINPTASTDLTFGYAEYITAMKNIDAFSIFLALVPYIMLCGTLVFIAVIVIQNLTLHRRIIKLCHITQDPNILRMLAQCRTEMEIKFDVPVYMSSYATTPFVCGIFRPCIVLPDIQFHSDELWYVFLHELTHLKRHDPWLKCFIIFINGLHWFNPLAYMARRDIDRYSELTCDRRVVRPLDDVQRRRYCELMLNVLWNLADHNTRLYSAFSDKRKNLERRVTMILKFNQPIKRKTHIFAVVLSAAFIILGTVTGGALAAPLAEVAPVNEPSSLPQATAILVEDGVPSPALATANADAPYAFEGEDYSVIRPLVANITDSLTLDGTKSKTYSFNMNNWLGTPHNAFNVKISNVSIGAKYTLIISYDGNELVNEQFTGATTWTVSNASKDQAWKVSIINDTQNQMTCEVAITSYIK